METGIKSVFLLEISVSPIGIKALLGFEEESGHDPYASIGGG